MLHFQIRSAIVGKLTAMAKKGENYENLVWVSIFSSSF